MKKTLLSITSKLTYVNHKIYEENLTAIHGKKICLAFNKPTYVGFTVLEVTKWEMYNFLYNFMIRKLHTKLLFTDTDSLCDEIHEKNLHKKFYKYKYLFYIREVVNIFEIIIKKYSVK